MYSLNERGKTVEPALPICQVRPLGWTFYGFDFKETVQAWCWQLCHTQGWRAGPGLSSCD